MAGSASSRSTSAGPNAATRSRSKPANAARKPGALAQDHQPRQAGLERLERQPLEHRAVGARRRAVVRAAPLVVVIADVVGRRERPRAAGTPVRPADRPAHSGGGAGVGSVPPPGSVPAPGPVPAAVGSAPPPGSVSATDGSGRRSRPPPRSGPPAEPGLPTGAERGRDAGLAASGAASAARRSCARSASCDPRHGGVHVAEPVAAHRTAQPRDGPEPQPGDVVGLQQPPRRAARGRSGPRRPPPARRSRGSRGRRRRPARPRPRRPRPRASVPPCGMVSRVPLKLGRTTYDDTALLVMAIVNRTPDSFYDRGATFARRRRAGRGRRGPSPRAPTSSTSAG